MVSINNWRCDFNLDSLFKGPMINKKCFDGWNLKIWKLENSLYSLELNYHSWSIYDHRPPPPPLPTHYSISKTMFVVLMGLYSHTWHNNNSNNNNNSGALMKQYRSFPWFLHTKAKLVEWWPVTNGPLSQFFFFFFFFSWQGNFGRIICIKYWRINLVLLRIDQ